jgi:hypothetical protein
VEPPLQFFGEQALLHLDLLDFSALEVWKTPGYNAVYASSPCSQIIASL